MQDNRQLWVLGTGGFFAILCLLPSWNFTFKIIVATVILIIAMVLAFVKYGTDRVPLELYLIRKIRYNFSKPLRYSYYGKGKTYSQVPPVDDRPAPAFTPLTVDWDESNIYFLLTVWLSVIGMYFLVWLYKTGALEMAAGFEKLLK